MKNIILFFALFIVCLQGQTQNLHQLSFKNLDGQPVSLSSSAGKKLVFIIVPLMQSDSIFVQLRSFLLHYQDSVQVIGIPSLDDGFDKNDAAALQSLYNGMRIILTEGMHTHKAAGSKQSDLFKWLTDKKQNHYFDYEVLGVGHKFFVNEAGRLYGSMPPQISFNHPVVNAIIHSPAN